VSRAEGSETPASRRWRVPASAWYLVYLGIMLFQPIADPDAGRLDWLVLAAVWTVFIPLYLWVEVRPGWLRDHADVLSVAIGVLAMPVNPGASVLMVYAAAFAGAHRPRRVALRWFAALTLISLAFAVLVDAGIDPIFRAMSYLPASVFVWVIGWASIAEAGRDRESARLRVDNARIEHLATVNERERIARDLHDILGHTLTSVVVRAQLVQRLAADDPIRAVREAAAIEEAARDALGQVRGTVQGWRQASLADELEVARTALDAAGVTLTVDRQPDLLLAPSVEAALALALREAVTNVVRHAGATRCEVTLHHRAGEVALEVRDDGRGGRAGDGGGLTGMRERIAALGGHVDRDTGHGTILTVAVPAEVAG
jgi:two-component system, NarL family, sensor histidine kinase DesK